METPPRRGPCESPCGEISPWLTIHREMSLSLLGWLFALGAMPVLFAMGVVLAARGAFDANHRPLPPPRVPCRPVIDTRGAKP